VTSLPRVWTHYIGDNNQVADVVSSSALTNMREKSRSTSLSEI
jgi:hypothetical protein